MENTFLAPKFIKLQLTITADLLSLLEKSGVMGIAGRSSIFQYPVYNIIKYYII